MKSIFQYSKSNKPYNQISKSNVKRAVLVMNSLVMAGKTLRGFLASRRPKCWRTQRGHNGRYRGQQRQKNQSHVDTPMHRQCNYRDRPG